MKKKICAAIAILSFLWLMGVAGSADLGRLEPGEIVAQGLCACASLFLSIKIGGFNE
jgi:hypothetical protein